MIKHCIYFSLLIIIILNVSIAQNNQDLSEGATVLFKGVTTKLTISEKNQIYKSTSFELNSDKKTFSTLGITSMGTIMATVYPVSLKKDGEEQIFIYQTSTHNNMEFTYITLYIKNEKEQYKTALHERSDVPIVLSTSTSDYPDLVLSLVAINGTINRALFRWDGKSDYKRTKGDYISTDGGEYVELLSKAYVSEISSNSNSNNQVTAQFRPSPVSSIIVNNNKPNPITQSDDEAIKQAAIVFYKWHENVWEKTPEFKMVLNQSGKPVGDEGECPCTVDWNAAQKYFDWMKKNALPVSSKYLIDYKAKMIDVEKQMKTAKTYEDKVGAVENFYIAGYHFFPSNEGAPKFSQSELYNNTAVWSINVNNDGTADVNTTFKLPKEWGTKIASYKLKMIKEDGVWKIAAPVENGEVQSTSTQKNESSDVSWLTKIPTCPCNYDDAIKRGKTDYPKGEWNDCGAPPTIPYEYHYGATYEIRWFPDVKGDPGQQCTYDKNKDLITSGLAAGTPDTVSPQACGDINDIKNLDKISYDSYQGYTKYDVDTWKSLPCLVYMERRPPNKGEYPCDRNDNAVSPFIQLKSFIYDFKCPGIIDIFKYFLEGKLANPSLTKFMNKGVVDNDDEAKYLLLFFQGIVKNSDVKKDSSLDSFTNRVIKYLQEYLLKKPIPTTAYNYQPFKMRSELVTRSKDNNFKWFSWDNAPKEINTAAMDIFVQNQDQSIITLAHQLDSITESNLWYAQVGVIDLDNNGVCGIIVKIDRADKYESSQLLICENGYLNTYSMVLAATQREPKPSELTNKIITNEYFTGDKNKTIKVFGYDTTKPAPVDVHHLVGGSTPEELGKVLLRALKTNNKNLWANCIHPDIGYEPYGSSNKRQVFIDDFDRVRERLIQQGITQWSLLEFSRVTYETFDQGIHAVNFMLEFTYKDFNGYIGISSTQKYNGKYFMANVVEDINVERNKGK